MGKGGHRCARQAGVAGGLNRNNDEMDEKNEPNQTQFADRLRRFSAREYCVHC